MDRLLNDLKYAFRTLSRSPGYVAVALLTLALGIGANTAVFSVIRGVLLRPLPYPEPQELVRIWELNDTGGQMGVAWRNFLDFREAHSYEALGAYNGGTSTVLGLGQPLRVGAGMVSDGFFRAMGVEPVLGRVPLPEEHQEGVEPVAVVSEGFWRTHLGGDPDLAEARLNVEGFDVRIVGVMPGSLGLPTETDIWYPLELRSQTQSRTAHNWAVVGRLAEGVSVAQADAELDNVADGFLEADPDEIADGAVSEYFPRSVRTEPLLDAMVDHSRLTLWVLLAAAGMLLLVACTNLGSTALARATGREREVAVRRSLGAGRGHVARLLFTESVVLAAAGGAIGVALAATVVRVLPAIAPADLPRLDAVRLDLTVLGFAALASLLTAVLFGLVPALRSSDADLEQALRSGSRGSSARGDRVWSGLVVAEVALALVLLVGAGLLIRSFGALLSERPGFRTEGVVLATLNPPPARYPGGAERGAYYARLMEELRAVPGVAQVGVAGRPPLSGLSNGLVDVRGGPAPAVSGLYQVADPGYFEVLDIPVLEGRVFDGTERPDGEHVVVVSRSFAELAWPGEEAVGKQMTAGGMDDYWNQERWATVIGVVGDIRQSSLAVEPRATYYFSVGQRPFRTWSATVMLRPDRGDGTALFPMLRDAILQVDPDVPVELATIEQRVRSSVGDERFTMLVLGVFAALGLVLALVGIYGVVSYSVARRTREMGIRIALGAPPAAVQRLVQRRVLLLASVGLGLGAAGALALTRLLQGLLHGVSATDPVTFVAVLAVMAAAAALAAWVPARRVLRIDPMITMQAE